MKLEHEFKFKPGDLIKSKMFNGNALYVEELIVSHSAEIKIGGYVLFDEISGQSRKQAQGTVEKLYELYKSGEEAIK